MIEEWRREYNRVRPHSSLGYRLPAPDAILTMATTQKVASFMGAGHESRYCANAIHRMKGDHNFDKI